MEINDKCVGCGNCHAVCPMGAISLNSDGISVVDQDKCVECSTCYRVLRDEGYGAGLVRAVRSVLSAFSLQYMAHVDVCPTGALEPPELEYPRSLRAAFSDPTVVHKGTGVGGRGTEEIKTNDVTGRLGPGEAGIVVELGRPGVGAHFRDVQTVAMALAPLEPDYEPFLNILQTVQKEIDTVFSVAVASRCLPDGSVPYQKWVTEAGYTLTPNGKTNLGLGRPLHGGD